MSKPKIIISKNGPYIVSGNVPLIKETAALGKDGEPEKWVTTEKYPKQATYALCRCGKSKNMPFCDGAHIHAGFDGTETADIYLYDEEADVIEGPGIILKDVSSLCSGGRFCHQQGGTWHLAYVSDDSKSRKELIRQACNCPAGRLVAYDKKTGKPIETKYDPHISVTEDPQARCSGPLWVKGGIEIESHEGVKYEIRNRVALCRCGNSNNKPFCDGEHIAVRFNDGDESLK